MSKKKKFKKFSKADILQEIKKSAGKHEDKIVFEQVDKTDLPKSEGHQAASVQSIAASSEAVYTKNDLKRVVIVLSFVLIILFVSIYLDKKTPIFNDLTDDLVKILNLNE